MRAFLIPWTAPGLHGCSSPQTSPKQEVQVDALQSLDFRSELSLVWLPQGSKNSFCSQRTQKVRGNGFVFPQEAASVNLSVSHPHSRREVVTPSGPLGTVSVGVACDGGRPFTAF